MTGGAVAVLRTDEFRGSRGFEPLMFSRTRHFAFADAGGRIRIESAALGRKGTRLFSVRSTGHEVALTEESHLNVLVPLRGRVAVATRAADFSAGAGDMLVFAPNERRTVVRPDEGGIYDALVLAVPARLARTRDAARLPAGQAQARLAAEIQALLALLRRGPLRPATAEIASERLEACLAAALAPLSEPDPPGPAGSLYDVGRAEDFMREHAGSALAIADVAAAAGLGVRALQAAFRRHRGLTPHEALTRIRLEEVRLHLLAARPGDRVTDVALHWGFTHLGRFSLSYAARFGEPPSHTLRRAIRA